MSIRRFYQVFALLLAFAVVGCEKDDDRPKDLSPAEAKVALNSVSADIDSEMQALENHQGLRSLDDVMQLTLPFGTPAIGFRSTRVSDLLAGRNPFASVPSAERKKSDEQPFNFSQWVGTFTYNAQTLSWDISLKNPADRIVVHFPTEGSATNNATWTIFALEEVRLTDEWNEAYNELAVAKMELTVDGKRQLYLDYEADWAANSQPESVNLQLQLPPYELKMQAAEGDKHSEFAMSIQNDKRMLSSFDLRAQFADTQKQLTDRVEGFMQYGNIKIEGVIDFAGILALGVAATPEKINEKIDFRIYTYPAGAKVGEIELEFGMEGQQAIIVFNDGSREPAEKYLKDLSDRMGELFGRFFGLDNDDLLDMR